TGVTVPGAGQAATSAGGATAASPAPAVVPHQTVPTKEEIAPAKPPVEIVQIGAAPAPAAPAHAASARPAQAEAGTPPAAPPASSGSSSASGQPAPQQTAPAAPTTSAPPAPVATASDKQPPTSASATPQYFYTVKSGDSLTKIAVMQLGSADAVPAIMDLNKD